MKVCGRMVCTQRVAGLGHMNLRILENNKGKKVVAVDPVGAREGNWVFTASGSAARFACPNPEVQTDLTIGGIIDYWESNQTFIVFAYPELFVKIISKNIKCMYSINCRYKSCLNVETKGVAFKN